MTKKEMVLFDLAERIIRDGCPPDQSFHLCLMSEEYYDGVCETCWQRCIMDASRGVYTKRKNEGGKSSAR